MAELCLIPWQLARHCRRRHLGHITPDFASRSPWKWFGLYPDLQSFLIYPRLEASYDIIPRYACLTRVLFCRLRFVTIRPDIISFLADVLFWKLRNWHPYKMTEPFFYKIENVSQNTLLSKSRFHASWWNSARRMKNASVWGIPQAVNLSYGREMTPAVPTP